MRMRDTLSIVPAVLLFINMVGAAAAADMRQPRLRSVTTLGVVASGSDARRWRPGTAFSGVATAAIPTGVFGPTYYYTEQLYYPPYPYASPYTPAPVYYEYPGAYGCQKENRDGWRYRIC
ncbi:MAG: hypothetical protein ACJ8F3_01640 [Xanthobacteraceae bacterium]